MNRFAVILLAAFDGFLAAVGSLALVVGPLVLFWAFGFTFSGDWSLFWPTAVSLWQLLALVPLSFELSADVAFALGFDEFAPFLLSLAPLLLTVTIAVFAFRSGSRSAGVGQTFTGVISATSTFALSAFLIWFSAAHTPGILSAQPWPAVLFPTLLFLISASAGAVISSWRLGAVSPGTRVPVTVSAPSPGPLMSRIRGFLATLPTNWQIFPSALARLISALLLGLLTLAALAFAAAVLLRSAEVVTLYQSGNYDLIGVIIISLVQLLYLPNLLLFALSYLSGAGFNVGAYIVPGGNIEGLVPPFPILGAVPELASHWWLLFALLPVLVATILGAVERSRMLRKSRRTNPELQELSIWLRLAMVFGVAAVLFALAALVAVLASGSIGPGSLQNFGVEPWLFGGVLALEVAAGLALGFFAPLRKMVALGPALLKRKTVPDSAEHEASSAPESDVVEPKLWPVPEAAVEVPEPVAVVPDAASGTISIEDRITTEEIEIVSSGQEEH